MDTTSFWIISAYIYGAIAIGSLIASLWLINQAKEINSDIQVFVKGKYIGIYKTLTTYLNIVFIINIIAFLLAALATLKIAGIW